MLVGPTQRLDDDAWMEWWRVDPVTGSTLGIGSRGWGQLTAEEVASRVAAYNRAAAQSIQLRTICNKYQLAVEAYRAVSVVRLIAAGGSPFPPPVMRVCY